MSEQIPKTMKAVVCHGPHDYRLDEIPVPEIGPEEILVKVKACGICAGDVKSRAGAAMFWGDDIQPQWNKPPVVAAMSSLVLSLLWAQVLLRSMG